jgi:diguanylate cyclase (GGDEF)-like protein
MPNRRALEKELDELLLLNRRYGRIFSAIMIDLDHFKRINDTLGHNEGDRVLSRLASIISNRVRTTDFGGRWGGEEFLVLCTETALSEASSLAEILRALVERCTFDLPNTLTASFGVAEYQPSESRETFVARIDHQLYLAKQQGRNRVISN